MSQPSYKVDPLPFIGQGNLNLIKTLIESNQIDCNHSNANGFSLIHASIQKGKIPILRYLLSLDPKPDLNKQSGDMLLTPLHLAVAHENTEAVRLLLQAGADVAITDHSGKTALQKTQNAKIIEIFQDHEQEEAKNQQEKKVRLDDFTELLKAVKSFDDGIVADILGREGGINLLLSNTGKGSLLHIAMRSLIEQNAVENNGAKIFNAAAIVFTLIINCKKLNPLQQKQVLSITDEEGKDILTFASESGLFDKYPKMQEGLQKIEQSAESLKLVSATRVSAQTHQQS